MRGFFTRIIWGFEAKPFFVKGRGHLSGKKDKGWFLAAFLILVLCGGFSWMARAAESSQAPMLSGAKRDRIITYIRDRFGVPDTVKLSWANRMRQRWPLASQKAR